MHSRHASDQAFNGYKAYIQHKLLQCILPEPCLPRSYPPCLLEWKAAKKHANMAVEATFPDGKDTLILQNLLWLWKKANVHHSRGNMIEVKKKIYMNLHVSYKIIIAGETAVGPVESWTTGEEFASHLLQCR